MVLKEIRKMKKCPTCGQTVVKGYYQMVCDECGKIIDEGEVIQADYIEVVFFLENNEQKEFDFCSWECFRRFVKKHKPPKGFDFVTLYTINKRNYKDFLAILKDGDVK